MAQNPTEFSDADDSDEALAAERIGPPPGFRDPPPQTKTNLKTNIRQFDKLVRAKPAPYIERQPPHDFDAEAAVLSAILVASAPDLKDKDGKPVEPVLPKIRAILKPGDFFSGAHSVIYDSALKVSDAGDPVDTITVAAHLKHDERLAQIGGMSGLTSILNAAPTVANVLSYAAIVRDLSRQRELLVASQLAVAELYARSGKPALHIVADLRLTLDKVERESRHSEIAFLAFDELWTEEPAANLVVPAMGLGPGPAAGVFGQGYSGKSVATFQGGLAVAAGLPFWGNWTAKRGRWLHFDYEQGRRKSKRLLQKLCKGYGVVAQDLLEGEVPRLQFAIYPAVHLGTPSAADHFARAMEGFTIATFDALKGMTPGIDENDSSIRDAMGALRLASERTGCMVLLVHHAGKTPKDGERPRKEAGRGSSAIFDECASVFVMSAKKGEDAKVTHEKDRELGTELEDFGLRIEDVPTDDGNARGGLKVTHLLKDQISSKDGRAEFDLSCRKVAECLAKSPGSTRDKIQSITGFGSPKVRAALGELEIKGEVVTRGSNKGGRGQTLRYYLKKDAPFELAVVKPIRPPTEPTGDRDDDD